MTGAFFVFGHKRREASDKGRSAVWIAAAAHAELGFAKMSPGAMAPFF